MGGAAKQNGAILNTGIADPRMVTVVSNAVSFAVYIANFPDTIANKPVQREFQAFANPISAATASSRSDTRSLRSEYRSTR